MSAASLVFTLAYFAVWDSLYLLLGDAAWAGPAFFLALPLLLLAARIIAYRGTHYTIGADRIIINHGGVFGDRSIELDLVNITLVEWRSPYLLKLIHGVGHIVIQEAGNAAQNARLVYIKDPQRIYRLIAKNMRGQGFSMQRNARIARQKSGILGALVDMTGFGIASIYSLAIIADPLMLAFGRISANIASGLGALTRDAAAQVENIEYIVSIIVFALSGLALLGVTIWTLFKFLELSRRTLTLHDDVVDYYQGFLSEKRQSIPLENLTDTDLLRPFFKRILGLSDLRISSRGAGSNLIFHSMPGAEEFARALERQLDTMGALKQSASASEPTATASPSGAAPVAPAASPSRAQTFKPVIWRAATGSLLKLTLLPLVIFAGFALFAALSAFEIENLGLAGAGLLGGIGIWGAVWLVTSLFGMGQSIIYAKSTEYSFDGRRASKTFDFLNRQETKFATEQITSFSILTTPLDRLLGTMTLRLRSIGSAEPLDFKHIANDPNLVADLEKTLDFSQPLSPYERRAPIKLTPKYTLMDGFKGHITSFLYAIGAALLFATLIGLILNAWVFSFAICLGALLLSLPVYILWQSVRVGRLQATLDTDTFTVQGGVLRHFRHRTAFRHIKGVRSSQYPASGVGELNISTGGGFTMRVDFLPAIRMQHDRVDSLVLGRRVASSESADIVEFHPNTTTELTRHFGRLALLIIPLLTMPLSLAWVALRAQRTRYRVEGDRIFVEIPLIFHRRTSVLFERVDHLESSRNMANKIFNTRDVEVYTVGSTTVDLELRALKEHERALEVIRERLAGRSPTAPS